MKYTEEDIVRFTSSERTEDVVGKECYIGNNISEVLRMANQNKKLSICIGVYPSYAFPFKTVCGEEVTYTTFIILKKESEKKFVPYDFSLKEDRGVIIGKRICEKTGNKDGLITYFYVKNNGEVVCSLGGLHTYTSEDIFNLFTFAETGEPVGKEI